MCDECIAVEKYRTGFELRHLKDTCTQIHSETISLSSDQNPAEGKLYTSSTDNQTNSMNLVSNSQTFEPIDALRDFSGHSPIDDSGVVSDGFETRLKSCITTKVRKFKS